jgi:hypothetical protein
VDSEVQAKNKLSLYEFNIKMYTLICNAYSSIKDSNIDDAKRKLNNIINELDAYYEAYHSAEAEDFPV